jgi:hypothetical protein
VRAYTLAASRYKVKPPITWKARLALSGEGAMKQRSCPRGIRSVAMAGMVPKSFTLIKPAACPTEPVPQAHSLSPPGPVACPTAPVPLLVTFHNSDAQSLQFRPYPNNTRICYASCPALSAHCLNSLPIAHCLNPRSLPTRLLLTLVPSPRPPCVELAMCVDVCAPNWPRYYA